MQLTLDPTGLLAGPGIALRATFGRGGIAARKREGDGATPAGLLPLRHLLYRADRLPPVRSVVTRIPLAPSDAWCDDPAHPDYNRLVGRPHPASHEALWRDDRLYDVIGVLGWNDAPVIRGAGSAIFLHVASPDLAPTQGCIALPLPDLLDLLARGLDSIIVLSAPVCA